MIRQECQMAHRVEEIIELILGEFLKKSHCEYATLLNSWQSLGGQESIQEEEQAKEQDNNATEGLVLWTDRSRKENEWVECAVAWKVEKWQKRRVHISQQKEVFDVEMYAIWDKMRIMEEICGTQEVTAVTIFADAQTYLKWIQLDDPWPGQVLAIRIMKWECKVFKRTILMK